MLCRSSKRSLVVLFWLFVLTVPGVAAPPQFVASKNNTEIAALQRQMADLSKKVDALSTKSDVRSLNKRVDDLPPLVAQLLHKTEPASPWYQRYVFNIDVAKNLVASAVWTLILALFAKAIIASLYKYLWLKRYRQCLCQVFLALDNVDSQGRQKAQNAFIKRLHLWWPGIERQGILLRRSPLYREIMSEGANILQEQELLKADLPPIIVEMEKASVPFKLQAIEDGLDTFYEVLIAAAQGDPFIRDFHKVYSEAWHAYVERFMNARGGPVP